jgi:hypothetical protein
LALLGVTITLPVDDVTRYISPLGAEMVVLPFGDTFLVPEVRVVMLIPVIEYLSV